MSKANPITNAKQFVWLLLTAVLLAACLQPDPQRPSRRMGEEPKKDTVQLALLEMNQQMALAADKQLTQFAQAQDEAFALYESNTWIHIYTPGDTSTPSPKTDEEWTVHMRVYDLKEHLLVDSEASYRIGKNELPQAVEMNIGEWHHGTKARLLAPWYGAFGMKGTAQVPPYENVMIDIEIR